MSIEEIIWDLRILLRQVHDDSSVQDQHLLTKMNMYRAIYIVSEYDMFGRLDDSWFQRIKLKNVTSVFSSDDPNIDFTTVKFGKITLPKTIEVGKIQGIRLSTASKMKEMYYTDFSFLKAMIESNDYRLNIFTFYSRLGEQIYIYPYSDRVSSDLILENPLDGYVFDTENADLTDLSQGISYSVVSGTILRGNNTEPETYTVYKKGEEFIADNTYQYSGIGRALLTTQIIEAMATTQYPISSDLLEKIVLDILTKDFQIERKQIADVINDSMDQIKLAFSEIEKKY